MSALVAELPAFEVLYDAVDPAAGDELSPTIAAAYGGGLALDRTTVYANMVGTIDGVAADRARQRSSHDISAGDPSDRFVMGLLRSRADAIVIGAGTLRAHPGSRWTADAAFRSAATDLARVCSGLDVRDPRLVVLTTSGRLPPHPALRGSIVISSERGAERILDDVAAQADVRIVGCDERGLDAATAIASLQADGYLRVLTEGGPSLLGSLLDAGAVDELFLTVSPLIAGRTSADRRPGIVDGVRFPPDDFSNATLRSIRRNGSTLFLRYRLASDREAHPRPGRKGST